MFSEPRHRSNNLFVDSPTNLLSNLLLISKHISEHALETPKHMPKHMFLPHPIHLDSYPNMYFSKVSTNPNMFTEPPSTSPNMSIRPSPNNLPKHWSLISNNVPKHVFRTQITYPSMQKPNNKKTERISTHVRSPNEYANLLYAHHTYTSIHVLWRTKHTQTLVSITRSPLPNMLSGGKTTIQTCIV